MPEVSRYLDTMDLRKVIAFTSAIAAVSAFGNEVNLTTVYTGVFQPENVIIHVTQNLWNFLTSTFFWLLSIPFFVDPSSNNNVGRRFGFGLGDSAPETSRYVAGLFRVAADTAETVGRFLDEL